MIIWYPVYTGLPTKDENFIDNLNSSNFNQMNLLNLVLCHQESLKIKNLLLLELKKNKFTAAGNLMKEQILKEFRTVVSKV